jgi:hypothetical protein
MENRNAIGTAPARDDSQSPKKKSGKKKPQQGKLFHDIVLLIIGFGLTSILGSAIGSWFQQRGWKHQRAIEYNQVELSRAAETFEGNSRVLDRRLYRTRLVLWDYKNADTSPPKREMSTTRFILTYSSNGMKI